LQHPKAGQKPIPETLQGWAFELLGVWRFLQKADFYIEKMGMKWWVTQRKYYQSRFEHLLNNPPEGARFTKTKYIKG
jgi:hypothetical protein